VTCAAFLINKSPDATPADWPLKDAPAAAPVHGAPESEQNIEATADSAWEPRTELAKHAAHVASEQPNETESAVTADSDRGSRKEPAHDAGAAPVVSSASKRMTVASLLSAARSIKPAAKPAAVAKTVVAAGRNVEEKPDENVFSIAAGIAAALALDPLGEDNIGRQIMIKMGWKGKGLGLNGNGIRKPIMLQGEETVYTRVKGAGLAHASELNPFKDKQVPLSRMESWEIAEHRADWLKGAQSKHWFYAGSLGDLKKKHIDSACKVPT